MGVQQDISDIYLLAKETRGVFVNIALQEPFGLTLIEAAVHGAPIVATRHGGPVDIINTLKVRNDRVHGPICMQPGRRIATPAQIGVSSAFVREST